MALIYITGIAGAGKSTVRKELLRRGYKALGGSEDQLAAFYEIASGQRVNRSVPAADRTPEWLSRHAWVLPKETIEKLRYVTKNRLVFVCSGTENVGGLWGMFDKIIALTTNEETLKERIATRKNGDWGKNPYELEGILRQRRVLEKEYKKSGALFIDSGQPIKTVVNQILKVCQDYQE